MSFLSRKFTLNSLRLLSSCNLNQATTKRFKTYQVVIVGGGSAGISMASKLKYDKDHLAIIEPSNVHYYQPLFTLVGAGVYNLNDSMVMRPTEKVMPKTANWIQSRVNQLKPDTNEIILDDGTQVNYNYMIVASGIELDFERIKGFPSAFEYENICSNYSSNLVERTWNNIKNFKGGNAIFTFPNTPIKCAGAPQKIAYLADDYFRKVCIDNFLK